jgi:hypothetical protein
MAAGFPMAITTNRNGSTTLGISLLIIADGVTNQRYFKQIQFPGIRDPAGIPPSL